VRAEINIWSSASIAEIHTSASASSRTIVISAEISSWKAILAVKEILAAGGAGPVGRLCGARQPARLEPFKPRLPVRYFPHWNEAYRWMTAPGQNDFLARLGPAYKLGQ
jgi:hypothetical protein